MGHPEIIAENFDEDVSNYFGLIKCTVLPPHGLFHPVLLHHGQDKLKIDVCLVQRSNLVKTEQIDDPQVFFDCLTSDEIMVLDADLVSDEILEIRYEYGDKFVQPDPYTNVVIAVFTTAYARLQLYDEFDMLQGASCTTTPIRSFISANPNLNCVIILAILPTNWEADISRYSCRADQRITVIKPIVEKPKSKYAGSHWIVRRAKKSTSR